MSTTTMQQIITQSFNALSQRTQIARYQSTGTTNAVATTDFTFDTANRLSGVAHKQGSTNLNTYAYAYDPLSRIATIVSTLEGTDLPDRNPLRNNTLFSQKLQVVFWKGLR